MRHYILTAIVLGSAYSMSLLGEDKPAATTDQAKMIAEMQQKVLQQFDLDKDGILNDQEKLAAAEAMRKQGWPAGMGMGMTPGGFPGSEQFIKQFDKDGDGKLSPTEQAAAMTAFQRSRANGGKPVVGRLPYGPGPGAGAGGQAVAPAGGAAGDAGKGEDKKVSNLVKRFDKDGDGKLDAAEKAAAQAELKKKNSKADKAKDK